MKTYLKTWQHRHLVENCRPVNHQILLYALSELDMSGTSLGWLRFYLSGRPFNLSLQGQVSNCHYIRFKTMTLAKRVVNSPALVHLATLPHTLGSHLVWAIVLPQKKKKTDCKHSTLKRYISTATEHYVTQAALSEEGF